MTNTEKIIGILKENNIVFYRRNLKKGCILLLPYQITNLKVNLEVKMIINNDGLCRMGFECKLNPAIVSDKKLLNLNSELSRGSLSIPIDAENEVHFYFKFNIKDDFSYRNYDYNLKYCFYVFSLLDKENIIDIDFYKKQDLEDE